MVVGNMNGKDTVRREAREIEVNGFACEQMDGDRIGGECIQDDHVMHAKRLLQ